MSRRPNVILLVVDTLRADHLGCYGYRYETSPNIDRLAREGALVENLYCAGIPTQPSFTTIFSGQHPINHGVIAHGGATTLSKDAPSLSQSFLNSGYTTCAVDNLVRERQWFIRGFEYYVDPSVKRPLLLGVTAEELHSRALPWIRNHADEPFFLFIHYWDPHWPLNPPERLRDLFYDGGDPTDPDNKALEEWWEHPLGAIAHDTWLRRPEGLITDPDYIRAMYDQEIRRMDEQMGDLFHLINELGLAEDTIIALTGDHGESMTEHDIFFAHHGLYDPVIHVPFIVHWPGRIQPQTRITQLFDTTDIAPTLLEAANIEVPPRMDGVSAWPLVSGQAEDGGRDRVFSVESTWQSKWSMRSDRYKLIVARQPDMYGNPPRELYDLHEDPGETRNLASERPDLLASLEREFEEWLATTLKKLGKSKDPLLEQEVTLGAFG